MPVDVLTKAARLAAQRIADRVADKAYPSETDIIIADLIGENPGWHWEGIRPANWPTPSIYTVIRDVWFGYEIVCWRWDPEWDKDSSRDIVEGETVFLELHR